MPDNTEFATLNYPGGELDLEIVHATEGSDGIALGSLLAQTGFITLDYGYVNTGPTRAPSPSSTASRDPALPRLPDRGARRAVDLPRDQLPADLRRAAHHEQLDKFSTQIRRHTMLHEDMKRFFDGFPRDAHPMAILSSAVIALSTFYQDSLDPHDPEQVELSTIRLLAKLPTIAAYAYKKSIGQPFVYPDNSLT